MNDTLDWLNRINEPFFRTHEEGEAFVARELSRLISQGWEIERSSDRHLTWVLRRTSLPPEEWQNQDYSVRITTGLDFVIFIHGNNDVGPFGLHHALHNALVIEAVMLRRFSFADCLDFLFRHCKPNEWGYT
jgi:hypothetical protein